MNFLAQNDPFGKITPPPGMVFGGGDPFTALSDFIALIIRIFIIVAGLTVLIFALSGAFSWITSGGEKEKLEKAQKKITNAIIGFIVIFVILSVFGLLTGDILGIIIKNPDGTWTFKLPTLQ